MSKREEYEEYEYTPKEGFIVAQFLTVANVKRSADFYLHIFGGKVIRSGEPTIIQIANSWIVLNVGGGLICNTSYASES